MTIESGQWTGKGLLWAYNNRALAHQKLGNNALALADVDRTLELDPLKHTTLNIRGKLRARLGNLDGAARDWARSFELGGVQFVRAHQEWLRFHGHYTGSIDGVYGPAMRKAMYACSRDLDC